MNETLNEEAADITLICKDCERPFEFTAGEQQFFKEKLLNPPKRCGVCRLEKKVRYQEKS